MHKPRKGRYRPRWHYYVTHYWDRAIATLMWLHLVTKSPGPEPGFFTITLKAPLFPFPSRFAFFGKIAAPDRPLSA